MMRPFLFLVFSIWCCTASGQNNPIATVQWNQDSTVLGSQALLTISVEDIQGTPASFSWDTTLVVPIDTTLKGSALDSLWEQVPGSSWTENGSGSWTSRVPIQFWHAGLFFYGGLNILDSTGNVLHYQNDVQTAMYVHFPSSVYMSQELQPIADIKPARHNIKTAWAKLLWPILLWTGLCLFIPLLLKQKKYFIPRISEISVNPEKYLKTQSFAVSDQTRDRYISMSRRLRFWLEHRMEIPAKEWTTTQLIQYVQKNPSTISGGLIDILKRADEVIDGYADPATAIIEKDETSVLAFQEESARTITTLRLDARTLPDDFLPEIKKQSLAAFQPVSNLQRLIGRALDGIIYILPILAIIFFTQAHKQWTILSDYHGFILPIIGIGALVFLAELCINSLWTYRTAASPGYFIQHIRAYRHEGSEWKFTDFFKRAVFKWVFALPNLFKLKSNKLLGQDEACEVYWK